MPKFLVHVETEIEYLSDEVLSQVYDYGWNGEPTLNKVEIYSVEAAPAHVAWELVHLSNKGEIIQVQGLSYP